MSNFLTIDDLYRKAPSIFTLESAERTSDKYQHISTLSVIDGLMSEGFYPTWVSKSNCRLEVKKACLVTTRKFNTAVKRNRKWLSVANA